MIYKIVRKQNDSDWCFVCGRLNDFGLKSTFYETECDSVIAVFKPDNKHQGYPNILHGGVTSAVLDEAIGRAIFLHNPDMFGLTVDLNIKFKKPIPTNQEIKVLTKITEENKRFFYGEGKLYLNDGTVAATGFGKYIKSTFSSITKESQSSNDWLDREWHSYKEKPNLTEIEI